MEEKLTFDLEAGLLGREDERIKRLVISSLYSIASNSSLTDAGAVKDWFNKKEASRQENIKNAGEHLTNSFDFLEQTFGDQDSLSGSQEMVIFLTELSKAYYSLKFVRETGNDAYYNYNKLLLLNDRRKELKDLAESLIL